jgi:hypothetical protein
LNEVTLLKLFRSPLLHFFAVAGLIFFIFTAVNDDPPQAEPDSIILNAREAKRLADQFTATWNRKPTESELTSLMKKWTLEEAFVREALTLGLDQGDAVIRQRLSMKMGYLAESSAAGLPADDEVLQTFLKENPERFMVPSQIAFDQLLIEPNSSKDEVSAIRTALQGGANPLKFGRQSLLPASISMTPAPAIDRTFGESFSKSLAQLPMKTWQGPIKSGYGMHMVRITDRKEATTPPLAEIRERVETEWRADKAQEMKDAYAQSLLKRYTISLPSAAEVLNQ